MPIATTDEHMALRAAIRAWATDTDTIKAVRAQDTHFTDAPPGLYAIGIPATYGGAGGDLVDVAVALEQAAESLIPGPILPTLLAGQVLRDTRIADGALTFGLALPGGFLLGPADRVLVATHGQWSVRTDVDHTPVTPLDFSRSLATTSIADAELTDLVVTLAIAEATGVANWCLRAATEYARTREQFGHPIGSYQAVKHLCAGMLCRLEQSVALAWDAARASADGPEQHAVATAAAAAVAFDAAVDSAKDCIQILGGIGFTWEHDAHLYLRRAVALRQLFGGGGAPHWRRRTATLARDGARRRMTTPTGTADRTHIRATVARIAAEPENRRRQVLAETGYLTPHWPRPYGLDASPAEQLAIDDELAAAGITRPDLVIGAWAAPTILRHGTADQQERFVGPTLRGEITWCQLFSEPNAGSDLAALRTRADRVTGGWHLTGQKVWTSLARTADWAICLARTDRDAPKHKGISYFLVDMRAPGIDVRPLREITGDAVFNEVFLDDVFVPDDCLVGQEHGGWPLARTTLANERVAMSRGSGLGAELERLVAAGLDDDRLGELIAQGMAMALLDVRTTLRALAGREPGPESSVRKLVGVDHRQAVAEAALDLLGPAGAIEGDATHEFLLTRCLSIAGGTTQILRTVAAERVLGLPRT